MSTTTEAPEQIAKQPEQITEAIPTVPPAVNRCHYVNRTITEHGKAADCNLVRLDGWFTRYELAQILSFMPDNSGRK